MSRSNRRFPTPLRSQRGAALFVALMILILLTLLALSAAQVSGLQERMASSYRADNAAFQAAEQRLRQQEQGLLQRLEDDPSGCLDSVDPTMDSTWLDESRSEGDDRLESLCGGDPAAKASLPLCLSGGSSDRYFDIGGPNCLMFRISTYESDNAASPQARAIVQSVYIP